MFTKEFDIRWSDLDANRHLANSAFINFMSHTRMAYLIENGFGQKEMAKYNIGPVIFYEHIFYFREVLQGKPIKVSFEVGGVSEDGSLFKFVHNFYDSNGKNLATCDMLGCWMDLKERKMTTFPKELNHVLENAPKSEDFKILTKEDTRAFGKMPKDLD
ncbi:MULTISPECIES: acyl-CoA thioesterase [Croceibacter]|jgi:acyl-CoA thioester hydrolase|uniref:acyl-CoA thioesterase n=1 Tax=Croceibacter TaxID=216431 RepID=UPI000C459D60|nr:MULTISPECIES: acyl-CoA thioesterase [Croceibacter]MBG25988.1 thioesterase [Croceibacter sp.]WSP35201.1 acyl-CoA thioesterase [Croceibacter atlanticus]HAT70475.1 thioesterase [Flavobacteriaceae bacterium]|tara:strand:- start:505 stop:981 length:477 start_codon:yes stop_codon:yes gene_type:complete